MIINNKNTMKKTLYSFIIFFIFFPFLTHAQEKQEIYLVGINFDSGKFSLGEVSTKSGYVPKPENEDQMSSFRYSLKVISFAGEILDEKSFSLYPYINYAPPLEGEESEGPSGEVRQDKMETLAVLAYRNNGKWIELYDGNMQFIEKKDIAYLAQVCGDGECQNHESFESCEKDCLAAGKDDYCNEEKMSEDPDCRNLNLKSTETKEATSTPTQDSSKGSYVKYYIMAGVGFLIIIFVYVAYYFLVKKNKELS